MLDVDIPGRGKLRVTYLVSDYNGTLACDGHLIEGVAALIREVSSILEIHVITADTFGLAAQNLQALPVRLTILPMGDQDQQKAAYVRKLGIERTVTLGNGRNDILMLRDAAMGICVMEAEGACTLTLQAADVVCRSAPDALNLLLSPKRLIATLRS